MKVECLGSSSKGNCYILELDNGKCLLLEAGVPFHLIKKKLGYRIKDLIGVWVTHEHADHSKAMKDINIAGIQLYASSGTYEAMGLTDKPRCNVMSDRTMVVVENVKVLALNTKHNANEPLMYVVMDQETKESLVFLTDTSYIDYKLDGFNYYMVECNYTSDIAKYQRRNKVYSQSQNHLSLANLINLLGNSNLSKCEQIILLHLSNNNSDEELMKKSVSEQTGKPVDIAGEGKEWNLSVDPF